MGSARVSSNLIPVEKRFGLLKFKTTLQSAFVSVNWYTPALQPTAWNYSNDGIVQKWKYIIYVI